MELISDGLMPLLRVALLGATAWAIFVVSRFLLHRIQRRQEYLDEYPVSKEEIEISAKAFGVNTNSIIHLYGELKYYRIRPGKWGFRNDEPTPLIGYVSLDHQNIMVMDPLCRPEQVKDALIDFARFTQSADKDCLVFIVNKLTARCAAELGFGTLQIGKEPVFELQKYNSEALPSKILSAVRQVYKKGVVIEEFRPETLEKDAALFKEVNDVLKEWFLTRRGEKLQLISEVSPFKQSQHKRYFLARNGPRVEGFLACSAIFGRNGYFFHDLIRRPSSLNGVTEALTIAAFDKFKSDGVEFASLGIVPLAGLDEPGVNSHYSFLNKILVYVFHKHETFFQFKSLYHFKKKFEPTSEETTYLAFYPPRFKLGFFVAVGSMFSASGVVGQVLHKWRQWRTGTQLPRPLLTILSDEVIPLARPIPFTFREIVSRCWFTCLMFILNVYSYVNTVAKGTGDIEKSLLDMYGFNFQSFVHNKWYVLVTSNFMHFNFWHLLGNMTLLLVFGGTLEIVGGTALASLAFLIGMNANIPCGFFLLPILKLVDFGIWHETVNYLDVGASLGIMAMFGTLLQFLKYKRTVAVVSCLITISVAIWQHTYIGIDHAFAIITGYYIGYVYLTRGSRSAAFQKLFVSYDFPFGNNAALPFRQNNRAP